MFHHYLFRCISYRQWSCFLDVGQRSWTNHNCQSYEFTTSNLQLHFVCYCMQLMWLCLQSKYSPSRPIWSILDQRLGGTKSKYNSTNNDSYTFHSFHIPSKYLQWFWRTSCYLDINNNTPYFVFAVLKIHSFLKIYFIKILLPKH